MKKTHAACFHIYEVQKVADVIILIHACMSVKTLKEIKEVISTKEWTVVILVGTRVMAGRVIKSWGVGNIVNLGHGYHGSFAKSLHYPLLFYTFF